MVTINLYSNIKGELNRFLSKFYNTNLNIENENEWKKEYNNPVEITGIIGTLIDNSDTYNINIWICIDKGLFITVTDDNANDIIKYIYERFPY